LGEQLGTGNKRGHLPEAVAIQAKVGVAGYCKAAPILRSILVPPLTGTSMAHFKWRYLEVVRTDSQSGSRS